MQLPEIDLKDLGHRSDCQPLAAAGHLFLHYHVTLVWMLLRNLQLFLRKLLHICHNVAIVSRWDFRIADLDFSILVSKTTVLSTVS